MGIISIGPSMFHMIANDSNLAAAFADGTSEQNAAAKEGGGGEGAGGGGGGGDGGSGPELRHVYWHDHDPAPSWLHRTIGVYVLVLCVTAVLGNVLVIVTCVRNRSLRTSSNLLVVNLAVGDLFMCAVDLPLFAAASFLQRWPFGKIVCQAYGSLTATAGLVTINSLAIISVDRYRAVSSRRTPNQHCHPRDSVLAAVCVWIYSVPWAAAPVLGWGEYVLDGIGTTCTFDFFTQSANNISFVMSVTVGNFALPLAAIMYSYSGIWLVVRVTRASLRQQRDAMVSLGRRRQRLSFMSDLKLASIILVIITAFLLSWMPYVIVCFVGLFGEASGVSTLASVLTSLLAKTSTALNPMIYSISHPKVRHKMVLMVLNILPGKLQPHRSHRTVQRQLAMDGSISSQPATLINPY